MSRSIARILHESVLVKYYINPIPSTLTQSIAISQYFQALSPNQPLIQYKHARDANTGKRLNWLQVVLHDPLPPLPLQLETTQAIDSDHSDRIEHWRKSAIQVNQVPFETKMRNFQVAQEHLTEEEKTHSPTVASLLKDIPAFTDQPAKSEHKTVILHQSPAPSDLEDKLLRTSQIILDSRGNPVPLETYLTQNANEYSLFTLDLVCMTREPELITLATAPPEDQARKKPTEEQAAALDRMRSVLLKLK